MVDTDGCAFGTASYKKSKTMRRRSPGPRPFAQGEKSFVQQCMYCIFCICWSQLMTHFQISDHRLPNAIDRAVRRRPPSHVLVPCESELGIQMSLDKKRLFRFTYAYSMRLSTAIVFGSPFLSHFFIFKFYLGPILCRGKLSFPYRGM
jgi:hypothetical protein